MRNLVKKVIYADAEERKTTAVISSFTLRELEDTCDQLALLHRGGIISRKRHSEPETSLFRCRSPLRMTTTKRFSRVLNF